MPEGINLQYPQDIRSVRQGTAEEWMWEVLLECKEADEEEEEGRVHDVHV